MGSSLTTTTRLRLLTLRRKGERCSEGTLGADVGALLGEKKGDLVGWTFSSFHSRFVFLVSFSLYILMTVTTSRLHFFASERYSRCFFFLLYKPLANEVNSTPVTESSALSLAVCLPTLTFLPRCSTRRPSSLRATTDLQLLFSLLLLISSLVDLNRLLNPSREKRRGRRPNLLLSAIDLSILVLS